MIPYLEAVHWVRQQLLRESTLHLLIMCLYSCSSFLKCVVKFASDWYTVTVGDGLFKVALEADGPHHYVGNSLHVTGKTALKKRLLSAMGWKVLSVSW